MGFTAALSEFIIPTVINGLPSEPCKSRIILNDAGIIQSFQPQP